MESKELHLYPLVPKSDSVQLGYTPRKWFWDDEETHVLIISSLCTLFTPHKAFPYETMVVMTRPMKQMMGSVHRSSHRIMKQLVSVLL